MIATPQVRAPWDRSGQEMAAQIEGICRTKGTRNPTERHVFRSYPSGVIVSIGRSAAAAGTDARQQSSLSTRIGNCKYRPNKTGSYTIGISSSQFNRYVGTRAAGSAL